MGPVKIAFGERLSNPQQKGDFNAHIQSHPDKSEWAKSVDADSGFESIRSRTSGGGRIPKSHGRCRATGRLTLAAYL